MDCVAKVTVSLSLRTENGGKMLSCWDSYKTENNTYQLHGFFVPARRRETISSRSWRRNDRNSCMAALTCPQQTTGCCSPQPGEVRSFDCIAQSNQKTFLELDKNKTFRLHNSFLLAQLCEARSSGFSSSRGSTRRRCACHGSRRSSRTSTLPRSPATPFR